MGARNFVLMKTKFIKNRKFGITITDIIFFLAIAGAIYAGYLYFPLVYKTQELEAIAKDYTFKSGGAKPDSIRAAVIEDASKQLEIDLNIDDVTVTKDDRRVRIEIIWRPIIQLPFGFQIPRVFVVEYERKQL